MAHVTEFLSQNLPLVIGWVVVLAATAFFNPYVTHRLHRAAARHDDHLAELKHDLLQPMLDHLHNHVLPISEHRLGNVGIRHQLIPRPTASVMELAVTADGGLCYHEAEQPPIDSYLDRDGEDAVPAFLESALCQDARWRHFRALFRIWDPLITSFRDYNTACIHYVEEVQSKITRSVPLPEFRIDLRGDRWIKPTDLAVVLFFRQLGLGNFPFYHRTDRNPQTLEYAGHNQVQGTSEEILQCISILDNLLARRERVESLMAQARSVRAEALRVKAALEDHMLRRRLRGRCSYLA